MKNKIFKVCALGLVTSLVLTGCGSKEGKVNKIAKSENTSFTESISTDNYYGLEIYQFKNNADLEESYLEEKDAFLQREEVVDVKTITKEDNVYEAIVTLDSDYSSEKQYDYILCIKNDKEYVSLYQESNSSNKEEVIKVGNEIKERLKNSTDYLKTYNEYVKENDLAVDKVYGSDDAESYKTALCATNIKEKKYTETSDKVETVDFYLYNLSNHTSKGMFEAKTSDGKIVWSLSIGYVPNGIGFEGFIAEQVGQHFYVSHSDEMQCLDIQSGKVIWSSDVESAMTHKFIETNNKLFDFQGDIDSYSLQVKDLSTGKTLKYIENFSDIFNKNEGYSNVLDMNSAKVVENEIIVDVENPSISDKKIGKIKVNINTYKTVFEG